MRIASSTAALVKPPCEDCGPHGAKAKEERALEEIKNDKAIERVREKRTEQSEGVAPATAAEASAALASLTREDSVEPTVSAGQVESAYRPEETQADSFSTVA
ncbi:MAG: hypothetical protein RMA76_16345 [Deltaproteobacteria bacterium]|jgi:hypothetical protein